MMWGTLKFLSHYTHHDETITIPDYINTKIDDLEKLTSEKKLRSQIIDSVYDDKLPPNVVLRQDPEPNSLVKENRTIYFTVTASHPPLIKMPNLVDASLRQAISILESYGLRVGKRDFKPDPCLNCIIAQTLKGKKIEPGMDISRGSIIDLVIGKGENDEKIPVPYLIGLTQNEAVMKIAKAGFNEGSIICSDCKTTADKQKARVFKQLPVCAPNSMMPPGISIDVSLTTKPITKSSADINSSDE